AIGVLYAQTLPRQLAIGWIAGTFASAAGLAASFMFDLPTGAAMVCAFGAALALAGLLYPFMRGDTVRSLHRTGSVLRWSGAVILAASALHLMAFPRADQPLLDAADHAFPALRGIYFTAAEASTYEDASRYAERYRVEGE